MCLDRETPRPFWQGFSQASLDRYCFVQMVAHVEPSAHVCRGKVKESSRSRRARGTVFMPKHDFGPDFSDGHVQSQGNGGPFDPSPQRLALLCVANDFDEQSIHLASDRKYRRMSALVALKRWACLLSEGPYPLLEVFRHEADVLSVVFEVQLRQKVADKTPAYSSFCQFNGCRRPRGDTLGQSAGYLHQALMRDNLSHQAYSFSLLDIDKFTCKEKSRRFVCAYQARK